MAASATARTAPARRTHPRPLPRRKPPPKRRDGAPRRRRPNTPITGFVPVAAARTAGAVGGLADSGLVVRLTRSRLWIGMLAALLVGIVGLNVMALSFNSSSSDAGRAADALQRQNSTLRAQIATRMSNQQIQKSATELGLLVPEPGSIRYVESSPGDAAEAAKRLRDGELTVSDYGVPASSAVAPTTETVVPATDPATTATTMPATTEPAATVPAATDPAATTTTPVAPATDPTATAAPATTDPATPATTEPATTAPVTPATPTSGGGVISP